MRNSHSDPIDIVPDIAIEENVSLAPLTTLGLGGPARYFIRARSEEALREAIRFAKKRRVPLWILGGGSNTIFPDSGYPGLVVKVELAGLAFRQRKEQMSITVAAGEEWDSFTLLCAKNGYAGLESLAGIPGATGAVPVQNVGAYGSEVGERIVSVRALDLTNGKERHFTAEECSFSYRSSRFKREDRDRYVILDVEFLLETEGTALARYPELEAKIRDRTGGESLPSGRKGLLLVREAVMELRRSKSMVFDPADPDSHSAGSFFTNPILSQKEYEQFRTKTGEGETPATFPSGRGVKLPAAWLVEHSGFPKGFRLGGVGVSSKHALALVNYGGSASELLDLSEKIVHAVQERFGVELEREPVLAATVGEESQMGGARSASVTPPPGKKGSARKSGAGERGRTRKKET